MAVGEARLNRHLRYLQTINCCTVRLYNHCRIVFNNVLVLLSTPLLHLIHCLLEVGDDVVGVFDADRESDEVGCYTGFPQLFVRELPVGVAGWMQNAGSDVCDMGDNTDEVELVHELNGFFPGALQTEGDDTATAIGEVFLCQGVVLIAWQTAVVDPPYLRTLLKPLGYLLGVAAVLLHTQCEGLETEIEEEGVLGGGDAAEVAHELCDEFGHICHLTEGFGIGETVVGLVGSG